MNRHLPFFAGKPASKHAYQRLEQAIFCLNGGFTLNLDDGHRTQRMTLDESSDGVLSGTLPSRTRSRFGCNHFEFFRLARA